MKNDVRIDVNELHPQLKHKLNKLLKECNSKGIGIIVTEGFRSVEYQDRLYAKGRTAPGVIVTNARGKDYNSQHQWRIAFDIAINYDVDGDGKVTDDTWNEKGFREVAKIAKSSKVRLAWGGDWTNPVDMPHFYLKKWGKTPKKLKEKYGTPDNFKKTFTARVIREKGLRLFKNTSKEKVLKKIPYNKQVNVLYRKLWYAKVEYAGTVGFVRKKYLG